jgi:hypothetical protein
MTEQRLQELTFAELKTALARTDGLSARRHTLRRECLRRMQRCNQLVNFTGLMILIYSALTLLLSR